MNSLPTWFAVMVWAVLALMLAAVASELIAVIVMMIGAIHV